MRGSLREKAPGVWELRVPLPRDPLTRRRRQRSASVRGTKREAQRELARLVAAADEGRQGSTQATLAVLLERWWEHKRDRLSPTTAEEYRRLIAKRIRPALGQVKLGRLTAADLDAFYLGLEREGPAPSSIRQVHALLSGALKQGVKWRWIPSNPVRDATLPSARRSRIQPPSPEKVRALMKAAEEHSPEMGLFIRLAALLGARRGEVCGLQWDDFDERTVPFGRGQGWDDSKGRNGHVPTSSVGFGPGHAVVHGGLACGVVLDMGEGPLTVGPPLPLHRPL